MALEADVKKAIIDEYATHPGDTGSPEVQVAILTRRIKDLTEHSRSASTTTTRVVACCSWWVNAAACRATLQDIDIERYRSLIKRLGLRR
ncbi:MAG: 30S ribosomal protein S15 [Schumannella sp.]